LITFLESRVEPGRSGSGGCVDSGHESAFEFAHEGLEVLDDFCHCAASPMGHCVDGNGSLAAAHPPAVGDEDSGIGMAECEKPMSRSPKSAA